MTKTAKSDSKKKKQAIEIVLRAGKNGYLPRQQDWNDIQYAEEMTPLGFSECWNELRFLLKHDFHKAFWGIEEDEEYVYLIDTSPSWAHDMGDVESTWVTEKELKKYCKAELKAFKEEHKKVRKKEGYGILYDSIKSKWEDPFRFAMLEMPAWEHYMQEMMIQEDYIEYLWNFFQKQRKMVKLLQKVKGV